METSIKYQLIERLVLTDNEELLMKVKELLDSYCSTPNRANGAKESYQHYLRNPNDVSIWDEVNRKLKRSL